MVNKLKKSQFTKNRVAWNKGIFRNRIIKNCEICNKEFSRTKGYFKNRTGRFCSANCRNKYFSLMPKFVECKICGKEIKDSAGGQRQYCSSKCYWLFLKSLHKTNKTYYVICRINGKSVGLHRVIMEKFIGRKLEKGEIVHHINGNKEDNRIENLELITQSEHIKKHFNLKKYVSRRRFLK